MYFKQFYLGCLAHASYLIGDEQTGTAVVVDPQRDVDQYVKAAHRHGLSIKHVFLTHFHADFLAGHLELRDLAGAEIRLGARAQAEYPFTPMREGDALELGAVRLQVLETPGHTPESISILVYDLAADAARPYAVLTGDALFVGDVGRPDLMASFGISAPELAGMLYDSLRQKLLALPDETLVYPAHGAGSLCGRNLGTETYSTIGVQRQYNYALQPMSKEKFVRLVTADQPEAPVYFGYDALLNRQERPTLRQALAKGLKPLQLPEALWLRKEGATMLDVREPYQFEAGHVPGSINIGLSGRFASWAGTLLDRQRPIVLVADPGAEHEAATRLGRIGFDNLAGYLLGGMETLQGHPELVICTRRVTAMALMELIASDRPPVIVDVRGASEWQEHCIPGSLNIPLSHLRERSGDLPAGRPLVVYCESGYRSAMAASLLEGMGYSDVMDLVGGLAAWRTLLPPAVAAG